MSLSDFFSPVNTEKFKPKTGFYTSQLGLKTTYFEDSFPELEEGIYDMAIVGVQDDRAAVNNEGCALGPDYFRAQFYTLHEGPYATRLVDLGNIKAGASISDTYVALKMVVSELIKLNIVPIIIGGDKTLLMHNTLLTSLLSRKLIWLSSTANLIWMKKIRRDCLLSLTPILIRFYYISQTTCLISAILATRPIL